MTDMNPAIFLDRDGVIIENREHYVRSWEDVRFLPKVLPALANAYLSGLRFIIVTNQSVVGRAIITYEQADVVNRRVIAEIERYGGRISGSYMCPHAPFHGCNCRKPKPGLLLQAAGELSIDLPGSTMIGDAVTDLQAGQAAGVGQRILVLTGRGAQQALRPEVKSLEPFTTYPGLSEALDALLQAKRQSHF